MEIEQPQQTDYKAELLQNYMRQYQNNLPLAQNVRMF